jgi:hypothetical protein
LEGKEVEEDERTDNIIAERKEKRESEWCRRKRKKIR